MTFPKQIALLVLSAFLGLILTGCQPSEPDSPKVASVTSIAVTPNPVYMEIGGVRSLTVTGTFTDSSTFVLNTGTTFASSAPGVAAVASGTGVVTAVAAGTATITATHTESGSTATTTVSVSPLRVLSIAVSPAASTLAPGATLALSVTGTYNNLTTGSETARSTFGSSNTAVATVDAAGVVTAIAEGSATITATHTASGKTGTSTIVVSIGGGGGGGGFTTITFDSAGLAYLLTGFEGAEDSTLQPDPTNGSNIVARVVKSATAQFYAGTTVSTGPNFSVDKIPFTATSTKMTVRVYSPRAGIPVRLKVEDAADATRSVETEALTTLVNTWETLTFDFANQVAGTAALNLAYNYNKASIFFDFGKTGADGGGGTFYFDDVAFFTGGASGNTGTCTDACIDFASASVKYEPFEGLVSAAQSDDPVDATNKVAQFVKGPTGQPWAGATVYTIDATKSVPQFDLSGSKIVTLRVYSPVVGMTVRMKLEDAANNAIYLEKDVLTTKANEWETLSFDFATPVNGVYNSANTYNRVSLFPAFSTAAPPASNVTVYFDELDYTTTGGGGGGGGGGSGATGTCAPTNCTDFSGGGIGFGLFENPGGGTAEVAADPNDAANDVVKFVKKTGDNDYFGTTITGLAGPAELTSASKIVTLRVFSPTVGTNFLFKLEGGPGGAVVEKDVVTTVAGDWETLSFDMSAGAAGTYATVVIFPNGRSKVTTDTTMYIDELKFPAASGGGSGSGSTGTCSGAACIDFSEPGIGFGPFENGGGGTVAIADDPNDATNKVVQFVKKPGDGDYFGTTITGLGGSVVLTATEKTVTMRVYSPAAGTNFLLKFEGGTGGPAVTEKDAATTVAGAWETLSFVMPDAGTYTTVVLFPNGRSSVAADKTMLVDELRFPAFSTGGGGGGGGGFINGVFADDYVGDLPTTSKSTQGGDVGFFFDSRLAVGVGATYDYAGVSGTAQNPGGVPNFYYGLGLNAPAITNAYFGAFLKAPGNGTVDVSGYTNIRVNVWGPDQLFKAGTFPALDVILQGPAVTGCGSASGGSEVQVTFNTTGQGADKVYTLPLSSFTLTTACSGETTVAQVLASIAQINIVLKNANIQYVNKDPNDVAFTNGLNVGSIKFN